MLHLMFEKHFPWKSYMICIERMFNFEFLSSGGGKFWDETVRHMSHSTFLVPASAGVWWQLSNNGDPVSYLHLLGNWKAIITYHIKIKTDSRLQESHYLSHFLFTAGQDTLSITTTEQTIEDLTYAHSSKFAVSYPLWDTAVFLSVTSD